MKYLCVLTLLIPSLLTTAARGAELLTVGDAFPALKARDQHEQVYEFEPGTRVVLIAFDMSAGKGANRFLADQPADYLSRNKAVYIANIYGMPRIGRVFALPKMRKYPHRIILADEESLLDPFPRKEEQVTVIRLDDGAVVESLDFWNPAQESLESHLTGG